MYWLITIAVNALLVLAVAYISKNVDVKNFVTALIVAFLIGILSATIGWVLRGVLNIATLGIPALLGLGFIIRIITSAIIIQLVDALMGGFRVNGWKAAFILAIVLAIGGTILDGAFGTDVD